MKNIPGDIPLCDINLPGTHDSATRLCQFAYFSRCQELSITEQLNMGVRFLDLRVAVFQGKLMLVHASARCFKDPSDKAFLMLDDVLSDCRDFLKANPTEALIISIKRDYGDTTENTFDVLFEQYLGLDFWYTENRIPTLDEVRGKAVFLNRFCVDEDNEEYNDLNTGLNFSGWPDQGKYQYKTHLSSVMVRRDGTIGQPIFLQDWYKLTPRKKWQLAILPTLEQPPCENGIFITFPYRPSNIRHSPPPWRGGARVGALNIPTLPPQRHALRGARRQQQRRR